MTTGKFKYFSPGADRAVSRYGTGTLIGGIRTPDGFVVNPEAVVAMPVAEFNRYRREYLAAVKCGDLYERDEAQYTEWVAKRKAARPTPPPDSDPTPTQDPEPEPALDSDNTPSGE